jgi:hypothetical protein
MATTVHGCTLWEIELALDAASAADTWVVGEIERQRPADLFVFSPGWNTSVDSARGLSVAMSALIAEQLAPTRRQSTGFLTALWPFLLFSDDEPAADGPIIDADASPNTRDVPAASVAAPSRTVSGAELALSLSPAFPNHKAELARIGVLLDSRASDPLQLAELHWLASGLVTTTNPGPEDDGESTARTARTRTALDTLASLAPPRDHGCQVGAFDRLWLGGRELLRVLTYYEMKNRAARVGRLALAPMLACLQLRCPDLRVHLIGHSFGARMVAYALTDPRSALGSPVRSMLLLQASFSHFSFAPTLPYTPARCGALAEVSDRVNGPLICTFTLADRAAGWWYPHASLLAAQGARQMRDLGFRWGALGHDGFQQDGVVQLRLGPVGLHYQWQPGRLHSLDSTQVINRDLSWRAGAHSDIRKPEIAWAAVSAAGLHR